jgi:hypothetical protein
MSQREFKDLTEAVNEVLLVQDACNARAVIRVFPAVIQAIERFDPQKGTDAYNEHPLVVLMLDKLTQLAGGLADWHDYDNPDPFKLDGFPKAYSWAKDFLDNHKETT